MKRVVKTPDKVRLAEALKREGNSNQFIADRFGVAECTIRNWLDPVKYEEHKTRALRWQGQNMDLCLFRIKERRKLMTQADRDRLSAKQRVRYATNPKFRSSLRKLTQRYRGTAQRYLASRVRSATLGWSDRYPKVHEGLMKAVVGMSLEDFSKKLERDGHIDYVVPICAFDLTNPHHLVRCLYHSNVRLMSDQENGSRTEEGLDIMSLPWVKTEDAIIQATTFISKQLKSLRRDELNHRFDFQT
jgi:transposase